MDKKVKSLKRTILEIIALADRMREETDALARQSKRSIGPTISTDTDYYNAPHPARDALVRYLLNLPQERLAEVAAVLYAGEGSLDHTGYPKFTEGVRRRANETDLAQRILTKPLIIYLREGMRIYNI